jgi:hypothetical protein
VRSFTPENELERRIHNPWVGGRYDNLDHGRKRGAGYPTLVALVLAIGWDKRQRFERKSSLSIGVAGMEQQCRRLKPARFSRFSATRPGAPLIPDVGMSGHELS